MKRNKHNLSHYKLLSADMGKLYPISCYEALPGDTIQMSSSVFLRFAPMLTPVIHPIKVGLYSFYVPTRLLWDDFEDFITGGPDGLDSTTPPTYSYANGIASGSVEDYLGVPVGYTGKYSALPIRAYAKIYNEYFRDQDLISPSSIGEETGNGNTAKTTDFMPFPVSWEKDYFTTCRPWPQKGPTVTIPVNGVGGSTIPVSVTGSVTTLNNRDAYLDTSDNEVAASSQNAPIRVSSDSGQLFVTSQTFVPPKAGQEPRIRLLSDGLVGSINIPANTNANVRLDDLREAFALQRFEEHRSAYGSRYTEYLRYLGVRSSDARLQRPEYLGGGKTTMQISEVLQTAADGDNPVGTLRGHGIGAVSSRTFRRFIEEHGFIVTLLKIQPIAIYEQGLNKMFSRKTKEDYWQRELEHIGQQEVYTRELYSAADEDTIFGYNNRFDEYRGIPSTVAGEMRSLLDYWHMARNFANEPVLNSSFISGSPTKRIFAEQTQNEVYCLAQHKVVARRILSKQGNPIM